MSLINDALKRASEAHHQRSRSGPPGAPLQPVHYTRPPHGGMIWLAALLVVTLIVALAFLWKGWQGQTPQPAAMPETPPRPSPSVALRTAPAPPASPAAVRGIKVSTNLVLRTTRTEEVSTNLVLRTTGANEATSAGVAASTSGAEAPVETAGTTTHQPALAPAFPELRLQSIIYRLKRPSAMINGQLVQVGDRIGDASVVEIHRQAVKVEWRGSNRTLSLPGP